MQRGYIICGTPRSGSNFLCQVLGSTSALGAPRGYFNTDGRQRDTPGYPTDRLEQCAWILKHSATANGVYGVKAFPDDLASAIQKADVLARLPALTYVRLLRRDLLGQAISMARAAQTKQFKSNQAQLADAGYNAMLIERSMVALLCANMSWDIFFARTGLTSLTLYYEDVEADPAGAAAQIAALMHVSPAPAVDPARITLTRQRDELNDAWRARYIKDMGGLHVLQVMQPPQ